MRKTNAYAEASSGRVVHQKRRPSFVRVLLAAALALAGVALLARGHYQCDMLWLTSQRWRERQLSRLQWGVLCGRGHVVLRAESLWGNYDDEWQLEQWKLFFPSERRVRFAAIPSQDSRMKQWMGEEELNRYGFGATSRSLADPASGVPYRREWSIMAPTPVVAVVLLLPLARVVQLIVRNRRRRLRGWCVACGYDLRESLGRCPECGVEAATVHTAQTAQSLS